MPEPNAPRRHSVVVLSAAFIILSACEASAPAPTQVAAPAPPPPDPPPAAPVPAPPLGRAELLQAMDGAASTYAAGTPPAEDALTGRRFFIRQAFGCTERPQGPRQAVPDGVAAWAWGPERRTIDIGLSPADWMTSPLVAAGDSWEAVEGLWLARPWLRAEGCPAAPAATVAQTAGINSDAAAEPFAAYPQTRGLAAVFAEGSSRLGRRNGRAYSFTLRSDGETPLDPAGGFRVVLEGRFNAFADGRAIRCHAPSVDQPPTCVAAVQLDRVAFEDAQGDVLREWRPG